MGRGGPDGERAFAPWLFALLTPRRPPGGDTNRRRDPFDLDVRDWSRGRYGRPSCLPSEATVRSAPGAAETAAPGHALDLSRSVLATAVPNASEERQHDKHDDEYE